MEEGEEEAAMLHYEEDKNAMKEITLAFSKATLEIAKRISDLILAY